LRREVFTFAARHLSFFLPICCLLQRLLSTGAQLLYSWFATDHKMRNHTARFNSRAGKPDYKNNIPENPEGKHNNDNIEDLWQVTRKKVVYTEG
jgi:hypothetical protein